MKRRRFLGLCGVAATGGVTALTLYDDGVAAGAPAFPASDEGTPRLHDGHSGDWTVVEESTDTISEGQYGIDVRANVYTTLFSYDAARERVAERTRGALDRPVVLASLTRVDVDSYVNAALTVDRLDSQILPAVRSQLASQGIENPTYGRTDLATDLKGVQRTYEVSGGMPIEALSYDDPSVPTKGPVSVPGFDLSVAGVVALWKAELGTLYVLGGVYPDESVTTTATGTVEGPNGETREVERDVTLEFDAATYSDAVLSLLD